MKTNNKEKLLKELIAEKTLNLTDKKRLFFVGDLHGSYIHLKEALKVLKFDEDDYIISVGDVIDRGCNSMDCLMFFAHNELANMVLGNHEIMAYMANFIPKYEADFLSNGGDWSFNYNSFNLKGVFKYIIEKFPLVLKIKYGDKNIIVSHAGIYDFDATIDMNKVINEETESFFYETTSNHKNHTLDLNVKGVDYAIHGHKSFKEHKIVGNRFFIDTNPVDDLGFNQGNYLTVMEINNNYEIKFHKFKKDEDLKIINYDMEEL